MLNITTIDRVFVQNDFLSNLVYRSAETDAETLKQAARIKSEYPGYSDEMIIEFVVLHLQDRRLYDSLLSLAKARGWTKVVESMERPAPQ